MFSYFTSTKDHPHPARSRAILKAHPEVRQLMGRNPWTALLLAALVALQVGLGIGFSYLGPDFWWLALIAAYFIGAFANHSLYVIIHEATHNLIFRNRALNRLSAIIADLPNVVPAAIGFWVFHLKHHAHLGDYEQDADVATEWEARMVGNRWYLKALWLFLFPVFQLVRLMRMDSRVLMTGWTAVSIAVAVVFGLTLLFFFGWMPLIYLGASTLFALGLHPLGARWIQEHYTNDPDQETYSYYGPLNFVALNMGYHNEHHDFPSVPWNRLPKLRAMAPEFYDNLKSHRSWTGLLLQFIFDPTYSLHSRVVREGSLPNSAIASA
jgi:sphingolipid delta-4 desaturase